MMANIELHSAQRPVRAGFSGFFTEALASFRRHREQRAVYRSVYYELQRLSDRDLDDLGISRFGIDALAREAAGLK